MRYDFMSRKQVDLMPQRIAYALGDNAIEEASRFFELLHEHKLSKSHSLRVLLVGDDGTYPTAILGKYKLRQCLNSPFVEAMTPQAAVRQLNQSFYCSCRHHNSDKYDLVIAISYLGDTPDIQQVYKHCKGVQFILITCEYPKELTKIYDDENVKIFSFPHNLGKESGMIQMIATLLLTFPFTAHTNAFARQTLGSYLNILAQARKFVYELDTAEIAISLKKHPIIHLFYDSNTEATAVDLENKFIQSGLAIVVMHEKKTFSYGRYSVLYTRNFGLVINLTQKRGEKERLPAYEYPYDVKLEDFLRKICEWSNAFYLEIPVMPPSPGLIEDESDIANIHSLAKVPLLVTAIGEKLGVDISRPITPLLVRIPLADEVDALHNYEGEI